MKAIIMAGGKGTRLVTENNILPKVLRKVNGKSLLAYVIDSISFIDKKDIIIVVGYMKEEVIREFEGYKFAIQEEQRGTGHAVMCGMEVADIKANYEDIIVLSGDVPLIKNSTIESMYKLHKLNNNACTLLSCVSNKKLPFGRIKRENNKIIGIIEDKDCSPEEKLINELNAGLYVFNGSKLNEALKKIDNNNKQGEYYLTDVPKILLSENEKIEAYITQNENELLGVNTIDDLKEVENILNDMGKE